MEDVKKRVVFVYLMNGVLKKKRQRKWWTHPMNSSRRLQGAFYTLYSDLKADEEKFFNYFHMSSPTFEELVSKLREGIIRKDTVMRSSISPEEATALTVRYLASGCSLTDIHNSFRIGLSTASEIVNRVCVQIWELMREDCIPEPDEEKWTKIAAGFEKHANFPNCIGAVDGKQCRIVKSLNTGSTNFKYKRYYSVVLMAVADTDYNFTFVDVGSYGEKGDSTFFHDSLLWQKIQEDSMNIPPPKQVTGTADVLPHVLVGDESFGLSPNLLRLYGGRNLPVQKKIFNFRLRRARRYVECTFGIMSNKWRIFHRSLNVKTDFAVDIVKACCVLHNYVLQRDGYNYEDTLVITGLHDSGMGKGMRGGRYANTIRDAYCSYFNSDAGKLAWQNDVVE